MSDEHIVGYIRVSTEDQHTERQLDGITLDKTFEERASGKDTKRPVLQECLSYLRAGDTLTVHSMDRLARSLIDLLNIIDRLLAKGVQIQFVNEQLTFAANTNNAHSTFMLQIMGAVAQFERAILLERQREGIAIAKRHRTYKGRKRALSSTEANLLCERAAAGALKRVLARDFGISEDSVYRYLRRANRAKESV